MVVVVVIRKKEIERKLLACLHATLKPNLNLNWFSFSLFIYEKKNKKKGPIK